MPEDMLQKKWKLRWEKKDNEWGLVFDENQGDEKIAEPGDARGK